MKAPHKSGRYGKHRDHEVAAVIVPFRKLARNYSTCAVCGVPFQALQAWHPLCLQCYRGNRLFRAISQYRKAVSV